MVIFAPENKLFKRNLKNKQTIKIKTIEQWQKL